MTRLPHISRDKAAEFDVSLLASINNRSGLVCLSAASWELAYNLLTHYGYWRSRYYYTDAATGQLGQITDSEWSTVMDAVDLAIEELRMTGCEDLTNAMLEVARAASMGGGGCGCGSVGSIFQADGVEEGSPPSGFDAPSALDDRKCIAANYIHQQVSAAIAALIASPFQTATTITASVLTAFAGEVILVAVIGVYGTLLTASMLALGSLVVALLVAGVDLVALQTVWDAEGQDIVDALYGATSASDARDAVDAVLDSNSVSIPNRGVAQGLLFLNALNVLFFASGSSEADLADIVPLYDCASDCQDFYTLPDGLGGAGTITVNPDGTIVLDSALAGDGKYRCGVIFSWNAVTGDCCGPERTVSFSGGTSSGYDGSTGVRVYESDVGGCAPFSIVYGASSSWSGNLLARQIVLRSNSPFSMVVNVV